ncbi:MAG: LacI family DNA-binding transcriptional regulator [Anaerolineaceae bacterium]|nr:LacI family DNA-binding transcriptional regulator [Anaerolineaceae bacterium]
MKPRRVTMRVVADEAGVSVQTVSRVLNNHPDVATATAERVRAVVERLNYTPNAVARSLIQQRSYTIGVATDVLESSGPARILAGIAYEAEKNGYCLLINRISEADTVHVDPLLQTMVSRQVDGIIWAVPDIAENHHWVADTLKQLTVPIVFLTVSAQPTAYTISIDNYLGARMATQHLMDQGYRRIAHISGPLDWWEARERKRGWEDTLRNAGLACDDCQLFESDERWSVESAEKGFYHLLETFPQMDAVFVSSDQMAMGVLKIASAKGIRIPDELGVVGYDGIPDTAYFCPPLTTVNHNHVNLGSCAVDQLIQLIDQEKGEYRMKVKQSVVLVPELVIRKSSIRESN